MDYAVVVDCGSMDVANRGWDKCPSEFTPLFKGKDCFPTVPFQVIVTHTGRKKVLHVSRGYPGAQNDKQIAKVDSVPNSLHNVSLLVDLCSRRRSDDAFNKMKCSLQKL